MKLFLFGIALIALPTLIFAQIDERKNFVYLYSDSVIYGNIIELKKPFLGASYIRLDSAKIPVEKVKFFQHEKGFFANTKDLSFTGTSQFSERISKGKLNLYEKETQSTNYSPGMYGGRSGISTVTIKNYYNSGFGPLKKASYKNISADLQSSPESMVFMNKFKASSRAQGVLYAVGGAAIIGGVVSLASHMKSESQSTFGKSGPDGDGPNLHAPSIALIGVGAGCFWASYFISLSKPKQLKRAIDAYNY